MFFLNKSEANASELLDNIEEMFPRYYKYMVVQQVVMFTIVYYATRIEIVETFRE